LYVFVKFNYLCKGNFKLIKIMKLDFKNSEIASSPIVSLVNYLSSIKDGQSWYYLGMEVEIDPTVDYKDSNVLVRWIDIKEGFNDKLIINSLAVFNKYFKPIGL